MCRKCGAGTRRRPPPRRRLGLVGNKGSAAAAGAGESARPGSARLGSCGAGRPRGTPRPREQVTWRKRRRGEGEGEGAGLGPGPLPVRGRWGRGGLRPPRAVTAGRGAAAPGERGFCVGGGSPAAGWELQRLPGRGARPSARAHRRRERGAAVQHGEGTTPGDPPGSRRCFCGGGVGGKRRCWSRPWSAHPRARLRSSSSWTSRAVPCRRVCASPKAKRVVNQEFQKEVRLLLPLRWSHLKRKAGKNTALL